MRLQAIELKEVGTFSEPVRINGIGPGLNVLAGANELGKSTILRALTALFTEQHRTTKASMKDMRPYAGGAPFVGCTFDLGGASWRLEKQFLSAHTALLKRLDGRETHQGADAENRLAELLGETGSMPVGLPLLWVQQGDSFEVPELSDGMRHSLGQMLAAQAEVTAGVGRAQTVLQAVDAQLGQLVTVKTGKARKNGAYDKLSTERMEVAAALDLARQKVAAAEERLARLSVLQQEATTLSDAEATAESQRNIAEHERRLEAAREAQRQLKTFNERITFLDQQCKERTRTLASYDEGVKELNDIIKAMAASDTELQDIGTKAAALDRQVTAATELLVSVSEREQSMADALAQARIATEHATRHERAAQLMQQLGRHDEAAGEIATLDAELEGQDWPDATIAELRQASASLDQLLARQAAGSPRVRIKYVPGRTNGFSINGEALDDGADVLAGVPMTIDVEGLGQIEIIPGASDAFDALESDLAAAQADVGRLLTLMGAVELTDAEEREGRRTELRQSKQLLAAEMNALAPSGRDLLANEIGQLDVANLDVQDAVTAEPDQGSVEALSGELDLVRVEKVRATAAIDQLKTTKTKFDERRAVIAAELRVRRTRRDELEAQFAGEDGADLRVALVANVSEAEQQLNASTRERLAVMEVALPDDGLEALAQALAKLRGDVDQRGERLKAVREEMRHIEGRLAHDFEDGAGEQMRDLEMRLVEIDQRMVIMERHVAALRLLSSELTAETAQRRNEISRPLSTRLATLATRVWPAAEVSVTSELTVDGLARGGQLEGPGAISAGTREQVAVLARLAYAGMLAEGAVPMPVILDDPLVFSDDDRLEALFDVIADAARTHQIIVLTCHERAFEPLVARYGATRLAVAEAAVAA